MDCQVVRRFLQVYLDGEFDQDERRDVEEHLAGCRQCCALADYERRFREAIRARVPRPTAAPEFRRRLRQALANEPFVSRFPRHWILGSIPAAAALALVISFTWTITSGFSPLVDEAVQRHSSEPPVEVNSADTSEVETWFRAKVNFNVALPRFAQRQLSLEGGRLSNLAEREAALIRYRHGGHRFSLFVLSASGVDLGSQKCQRVQHNEFCLVEVRGYSVVSWRSRGLLYSMVGDTSPTEILRVVSTVH